MSRSAGRRTVVASFGGLAALAGLAGSAWACTAAPAITSITPIAGAPGTEVTVSGKGYAVAPVEIRWNGVAGPVLATVPGPTFSVEVKVPAEAAGGMFYITAVQRDGSGSVSYKVADTFEVIGPAATTAPAPGLPPAPATDDLWSGVARGSGLSTLDASTDGAPGARSPNSADLRLGLGLIGVATAALLAALAVPLARRRHVLARK